MNQKELKRVFDHQRILIAKLALPNLNAATREGLEGHLARLQEKAEEILAVGRDYKGEMRWLVEHRRRAVRRYLAAMHAGDAEVEMNTEAWIEQLDGEIDVLAVMMEQGEQLLDEKPTDLDPDDQALEGRIEKMFSDELAAIDLEEARDV